MNRIALYLLVYPGGARERGGGVHSGEESDSLSSEQCRLLSHYGAWIFVLKEVQTAITFTIVSMFDILAVPSILLA